MLKRMNLGLGAKKKPATPSSDVPVDEQSIVTEKKTSRRFAWLQKWKNERELAGDFTNYPHLLAMKPKERYVFRSDYFEVDQSVACVLAFFHTDTAQDGFAAFWGIDRIPGDLEEGVTAIVLEQVCRMSDKWIDQYTKQSERLENLDHNEQAESGTTSSKMKAAKKSSDLEKIVAEIQNGASYLSVHNRLFLKAPNLDVLDASIEHIARLYIDRFQTIKAEAYAGEQRDELSSLWKNNDKKRGSGFHFTSTELAGSYSLVTNGLNDKTGEYVGHMVGDVNNSAVLMDVNNYSHHVVIADSAVNDFLGREYVTDMWCSKLSQATMLNNGKVVHIVLDGANLDVLGPKFERLTSRVDLNAGDVNMFEMFGDPEDEMSIFATHIEKLKLMFDQMYLTSDGADASIVRAELENVAKDFYIDQRMWHANAKDNRHRLRVVGIPHDQVPRLQMFQAYLNTAHKKVLHSQKNDPNQLKALKVLSGICTTLLNTNGDLFNNYTSSAIDGVQDSRRVVYDFSHLMQRGKGVAMAQLVNILGFAVANIAVGDTVIIHGTEQIDERVKPYIRSQFDHLFRRGGRVVYGYNSVDAMLDDSEFNAFDAADYTIFGSMREKTVTDYQKQLHQEIPPDLVQLITQKGENLSYLRRGVSNVVFHLDLSLGINPHREEERQHVYEQARQAGVLDAPASARDDVSRSSTQPAEYTQSITSTHNAHASRSAQPQRKKKTLKKRHVTPTVVG